MDFSNVYKICKTPYNLFSIFSKGEIENGPFETKMKIVRTADTSNHIMDTRIGELLMTTDMGNQIMDIRIGELTEGSLYDIKFSIGLYEGK